MLITPNDGYATLINTFTVEPEKQQQLIDLWLDMGKQFERLPGFIATVLHKSTDGTRVVNYAQWERAEDWENLVKNAGSQFSRFRGIGTSDAHLYEVVYFNGSPLTPKSGYATLINTFTVEPEKQQQLIDLWLDMGKQFEHLPGFVATALHKSTDGTRVVNYAQWERAEDWENLVKNAGSQFSRFKGIGTSDAHLYEVVYLSEASSSH